MSDLQLSFIGLGIALVGGVFAYNKWQERKHRKLAERVFRSDHPDVLLGSPQPAGRAATGRRGTHRAGPAEGGAGRGSRAGHRAAPAAKRRPTAGRARRGGAAGIAGRSGHRLRRPLRIRRTIGGPISGRRSSRPWASSTKPLCWCGLNERTGAWERLTAHGAGDYRRLRVALQLADRRGPLTDPELTMFLNGVQRLADEFLAVADMPARNDVLARAAEIDRFCAGVDIQIGVNVVAAGAPFAGTKLRGLAEAAGMTLREDGMFHAARRRRAPRCIPSPTSRRRPSPPRR
jgi:hypothetical protein